MQKHMEKKACVEIPVLFDITPDKFKKDIYLKRSPVILRGIDIGSCVEKWTPNYLADKVGSQDVKIHVCAKPHMDFLNKNFLYRSLPFNELITRASESKHSDYFLSEDEFYYLRSVGANPRKDVADIRRQFPYLADDIKFPEFFEDNNFFSSVFRIASSGVCLWTHYDIMDNLLIQVKGCKRAVLFPPDDALNLYMNGDKSKVLDIDNPDLEKYPLFAEVDWHEGLLEAGDILFIPALWFHNMTSLDFGIAINVFWRHLNDSVYDSKDTYGNKDLIPAAYALTLLNKALKSLNHLPEDYKRFYGRRMIAKIQEEVL